MKTPILYIGAPGIGKTAIIKTRYDFVEVLLLSSCVEEDIAGIPYREGDLERRTIPRFIQNLKDSKAKKKCLFLDELDKARREVADTLLSLITSPELFGLPEEVEIVAAANPSEWGGGDGISQPMQSRFSVINFNPSIEIWGRYMLETYPNNNFVNKIVEHISSNKVPLLESNGEGYSWRLSCPRTWELAIKAVLQPNNNDNIEEIITGLLTPNCASALISFLPRREIIEDVQELARSIGSKMLIQPVRL